MAMILVALIVLLFAALPITMVHFRSRSYRTQNSGRYSRASCAPTEEVASALGLDVDEDGGLEERPAQLVRLPAAEELCPTIDRVLDVAAYLREARFVDDRPDRDARLGPGADLQPRHRLDELLEVVVVDPVLHEDAPVNEVARASCCSVIRPAFTP